MYSFILKYVNKFLSEPLHIFQDNYLIILVSISFNSFLMQSIEFTTITLVYLFCLLL